MSRNAVESGLIGNRRAAAFLDRTLERGTVAHGLLFLGPAGVGKRTALGFFLAALLRSSARLPGRTWAPAPSSAGSDGLAAFHAYPDFSLIARERDEKTEKLHKNISIEQVRELRQRLQMGSFLSSWKVAIVDGAEYLSPGAANALLKTLEEPTPKTLLVLMADARLGIPDTVLSRLQLIRFGLASRDDIRQALLDRGVARPDADALAGRAAGRPGIALTLAADAEQREEDDTRYAQAVAALDAPLHERLAAFQKALPERAGAVDQAQAAKSVLAAIGTALADALSLSLGEPGRVRLPEFSGAIGRYAAQRGPGAIAALLEDADRAAADLDANINPKLVLDHIAFVL